MTRPKSPRAHAIRQKCSAPPPPSSGVLPFSAFLAGAFGEASQAIANVQNALNTTTGTMLTNLLLVEGKSLEEAAVIMGVPHAKLREDGVTFTIRLGAALAPNLMAATARAATDIEAEIAKARAFEATAHLPGTMI